MGITDRKHKIMQKREVQIRRNALAVDGGRDYIDERLWRAPNETDTSWNGDPQRGIVGRKERTGLVNDAGRVANKINQYIFKEEAKRDGADAGFLADCTGEGESVHDFMQRVNTAFTYGRWCWLQADRAPLAEGESETEASKAPIKWVLWDALDVPDWCIDAAGNIKWLITRSAVYMNEDPHQSAKDAMLYTLYELGADGHVYVTEKTDKGNMANLRTHALVPGLERLPFALIGRPSSKPWWFDDVEGIQAQILNLDSMHYETLLDTVFPQLVLPSSIGNSLETRLAEKKVEGKSVVTIIRELTLGRKIPIMEGAEDKGISRFITPSGDLKLLTEEAGRKRSLLFDMVGLALFNKETRQIQTAESKQFDQLDTNSTLANRALVLQRAEAALIKLSQLFDKGFRSWEPAYPSKFDVVDVSALSQALTQTANMPNKTPKVKRIEAKCAVRVLKEVAAGSVTQEEIDDALAEIDATDFEEPTMLPNPFEGLEDRNKGGEDDE
ncbi:MAG: hypothetical protein IKF72_12645 [Kiritimatiellae bacterium]|nr:hypothetical protein [Kiritimatiellia bacterium]